GAGSKQAPFHQMMRIMTQDIAVLAGTGLGFVGIDQQVMRAAVTDLGHEGPFERSRETGATPAAQARGLDLIGDPVATGVDELLGAHPGAARTRALERPVALAVEIGENAIFISEHSSHSYRDFLPKTRVYSSAPPRASTSACASQLPRAARPLRLRDSSSLAI